MLRYLHSFPTRRSSDLATYINIEPTIIAVVVAVAASASFSTPIGYQTNLIVYGPGGYTFKDYFKVGLPLRSEEHTSELQSRGHLVCRLLLEKKNKTSLY